MSKRPQPDLRPYAKRLATAMPDRFVLYEKGINHFTPSDPEWSVHDRTSCPHRGLWAGADEEYAWRFFGPLAVEFDVHELRGFSSLDEALADAVCAAVERKGQ